MNKPFSFFVPRTSAMNEHTAATFDTALPEKDLWETK